MNTGREGAAQPPLDTSSQPHQGKFLPYFATSCCHPLKDTQFAVNFFWHICCRYRELKDAVLFPTAMINSDPPAAASREGREKEQRWGLFYFMVLHKSHFRINFLPGRERDGWARERNGSLPSRAEGLPSREGFLSNMGGRWGGGGGGAEASPAGAQQQQRRAPRTSPPVLHHHHHQAPPDHPQFIPPPVRWTFCRFTQIYLDLCFLDERVCDMIDLPDTVIFSGVKE